MKQKSLAVELLRKLLDEQVRLYQRKDFVRAQKFSERMQKLMNAYRNSQLTNADVIEKLKKIAYDISTAHQEGRDLSLSQEELASYPALSNPLRRKDYYTNDQLKAITQELTETLRKNRIIDWARKKGAKAAIMMVKRLLKKYRYPPEDEKEAVNTVISNVKCGLMKSFDEEP